MKPSLIKPLTRVTLVTLLTAGLATGETRKKSSDLDGDGIANINDPDVDGDGIPNGKDRNVDGGVCRRGPFKGLYVGDRFANDSPRELDIDGDGRKDDAANENDIDGDGIKNNLDKDRDGDGKKDSIDKDDDGDGIPDKKERRSSTGSLKLVFDPGTSSEAGLSMAMDQMLPFDWWLGGSGSISVGVPAVTPGTVGPGFDGGALDGVSVIDEGAGSIEALYAEMVPQGASAMLQRLSDSGSFDRQISDDMLLSLLENSVAESGERLEFLEKLRTGLLLRRSRETSSDAEAEEIAPEDSGSPAVE